MAEKLTLWEWAWRPEGGRGALGGVSVHWRDPMYLYLDNRSPKALGPH